MSSLGILLGYFSSNSLQKVEMLDRISLLG